MTWTLIKGIEFEWLNYQGEVEHRRMLPKTWDWYINDQAPKGAWFISGFDYDRGIAPEFARRSFDISRVSNIRTMT